MPHRSVGGVNLPGYDESLGWEVYLERTGINTLALCHDVSSITTQSKTFYYRDKKGKKHKYTPDFIFHIAKVPHICEVKPVQFLLESETRKTLAMLTHLFQKEGFRFVFLTDDQLMHRNRDKNITFIIRYKSHHISNQFISSLNSINDRIIKIADLLPPNHAENDLANVYAAIAQKQLCLTNWYKKVGIHSEVFLPSTNNRSLVYEEISNSGRYGHFLQKLVLEGGPEADRIVASEKSKKQQITHYNPIAFF
ncbi:MAG: TnsA endonuclease N-terminal domain-containing protein [Flavobacteriaceae bacterium]|nr:TnsA endonuclease N-terminal domain-containing protein [Flavobacteriaceae bacterium]